MEASILLWKNSMIKWKLLYYYGSFRASKFLRNNPIPEASWGGDLISWFTVLFLKVIEFYLADLKIMDLYCYIYNYSLIYHSFFITIPIMPMTKENKKLDAKYVIGAKSISKMFIPS